jgi:hypothetical protein
MFCSLNNLTKLDENVNHLAKRLSNFPWKFELYCDIKICAKMDTAANFMQQNLLTAYTMYLVCFFLYPIQGLVTKIKFMRW